MKMMNMIMIFSCATKIDHKGGDGIVHLNHKHNNDKDHDFHTYNKKIKWWQGEGNSNF